MDLTRFRINCVGLSGRGEGEEPRDKVVTRMSDSSPAKLTASNPAILVQITQRRLSKAHVGGEGVGGEETHLFDNS